MTPPVERQTPETGPMKKVYSAPRLEVYGKLRDIAQTVGKTGIPDGTGAGNPNHLLTR
jgi:hypothetical protein